MKRGNKINLFLLVLGIALFIYLLSALGADSIELMKKDFNMKYLTAYIFVTALSFLPFVWRWQIILSAYGHKISFFSLLKMQMAGYALGYVTPSARIGGEPLRVYMLNKEEKVDYRIGTASVILDKYMEFMGTVSFGILGLIMLFIMPGISIFFRVLFFLMIFTAVFLLWLFYYRLSKGKPFFVSIFRFFINEEKRKKFLKNLKRVDSKMGEFINHHKREFFLSYAFYIFSAIIFISELKLLLLSFGISTTFFQAILAVIVFGIASYLPLPMAIGSLEAGEAGLFHVLMNNASIGIALSLVYRARGLFFSAIGFIFIASFGGKGFFKKTVKRRD